MYYKQEPTEEEKIAEELENMCLAINPFFGELVAANINHEKIDLTPYNNLKRQLELAKEAFKKAKEKGYSCPIGVKIERAEACVYQRFNSLIQWQESF